MAKRGLRGVRQAYVGRRNRRRRWYLACVMAAVAGLVIGRPEVAGATTSGWSSGTWSGSPAESYLYAAEGLIQGTGEGCTYSGSLDPTFSGGASTTVYTNRALMPFSFLTSYYYAIHVCGYGGTATQWGDLQASWLASAISATGLNSYVNTLFADVETGLGADWEYDSQANNQTVVYSFESEMCGAYGYCSDGIYSTEGMFQQIFGTGNPNLGTHNFWLSSWGPSLSQLNSQEDYFVNYGYTIVSWQYTDDHCYTTFSHARALGRDASPSPADADKWTNSHPDQVCMSVTGFARTTSSTGYWMVTPEGGVFNFGNAAFDGSLATNGTIPNASIDGIAATPDGGGYWVVGADGGVFNFGSALYEGGCPGLPNKCNATTVAISADPASSHTAYWTMTAVGSIYTWGGAPYYGGSPTGYTGTFVAMAPTPDGGGYWLVDSTGQIYNYGDARYLGGSPSGYSGSFVGMSATPDGGGYWLVDSTGQIYTYGDAPYYGNAPNTYTGHFVGMGATGSGNGYWLLDSCAQVYTFNGAPYEGGVVAVPGYC